MEVIFKFSSVWARLYYFLVLHFVVMFLCLIYRPFVCKMTFVSEVVLVKLLKPFAVKFEFHLFFLTRQERLEYIYMILEAFLGIQRSLSVFIM